MIFSPYNELGRNSSGFDMYGQGGGGYDPQYNNYNDPYNQQPPSGAPQQQQQPPPHQQTQQQGGGVNSRSGLYKYILL